MVSLTEKIVSHVFIDIAVGDSLNGLIDVADGGVVPLLVGSAVSVMVPSFQDYSRDFL